MNWNTFTELSVKIEYANMAQMNKIRSFARKCRCRVEVSRYARDAYEGRVIVPLTTNRESQQNTVEEIACFIGQIRNTK